MFACNLRPVTILTLATAFCTTVSTGPAFAALAYSEADNEITSLSIFGFEPTLVSQVTQLRNVASYEGAGIFIVKTDALDPLQAKAGDGPFPDENEFSANGEVGGYARADSKIAKPAEGFDVPKGFSLADNIAETSRFVVGTSGAIAHSEYSTLIGDVHSELNIQFNAWPSLQVEIGHFTDFADAGISFSIELGNYPLKASKRDCQQPEIVV